MTTITTTNGIFSKGNKKENKRKAKSFIVSLLPFNFDTFESVILYAGLSTQINEDLFNNCIRVAREKNRNYKTDPRSGYLRTRANQYKSGRKSKAIKKFRANLSYSEKRELVKNGMNL